MWKYCKLLLVGCVLTGVATSCNAPGVRIDGDAPREVRQFARQVGTLHTTETNALEPLLDCFHWDDVRPETRQAIERSLSYDLETPLIRITLEPWNPSEQATYYGTETQPNLQPSWVMHLHYDSTPRHVLSLPMGDTASGFRIANPMPLAPDNTHDDGIF